MVGDVIVIVTADDCVHHVDVASEHLVKMSTLAMGLRATLDRWCEVALGECLAHHSNVVVEVAADDDRGMRVLFDDVSCDVHDLSCAILQLLLLTWLDIAVEHLNSVTTDLQLSPTQMRAHGLHQREFRIGERRCPTSTVALSIGLE
jgi:hypothetical protein